MLELSNIKKVYHRGEPSETTLFQDFSLKIESGEYVSVIGSNGSGKTSLLNIICGSIPVDSGHILIDGKDVTGMSEHLRCRRIGRVYQDPSMGTCGGMTVLENMALADNKGKTFGLRRGVDASRIPFYREQLSLLGLGLEDRLQNKAGALSGGERQAVALLMSAMTPIDFLILDEHTAALDPATAEIIMKLTDKIVREKHLTAFMVTHNLRYAAEYGDRLLMLHKGQTVLDRRGVEKESTSVRDILGLFNEISVECGN